MPSYHFDTRGLAEGQSPFNLQIAKAVRKPLLFLALKPALVPGVRLTQTQEDSSGKSTVETSGHGTVPSGESLSFSPCLS